MGAPSGRRSASRFQRATRSGTVRWPATPKMTTADSRSGRMRSWADPSTTVTRRRRSGSRATREVSMARMVGDGSAARISAPGRAAAMTSVTRPVPAPISSTGPWDTSRPERTPVSGGRCWRCAGWRPFRRTQPRSSSSRSRRSPGVVGRAGVAHGVLGQVCGPPVVSDGSNLRRTAVTTSRRLGVR